MTLIAAPAQSLLALLQQRVDASPDAPAATYKSGGAWREASWSELQTSVFKVAAGLLRLDIRAGDRVSIFAATRYEWTVADLAAMAIGAIVVPIYASNTAEEARYILEDSGAIACIVDDDVSEGRAPGRLTRLKQAASGLPGLKSIISIEALATTSGPLHAWSEWLATNPSPVERSEINRRIAALGPGDVACLIYTSGTTGNPKGVEITHGNWAYEAEATRQIGLMRPGSAERVMLFLPLAHSFAKVTEATWLSIGFTLAFAESIEKVIDNCGEVHPTCMPSVPRIFEKVYLKVAGDGAAAPRLSGTLFRAAMAAFEAYAHDRIEHGDTAARSMRYRLLKRLVFRKVKARLDLRLGGQMRLFISGGAPLSRKLLLFFEELGFEILEGYGLSETSAGTCVNPPGKTRLGTVGPPLPGTEARIAPDGEILIRGPGVMRGYYGHPDATREAIEPDGFFHTGDIGDLDSAGYLRITDRKKDIIVTAGGKKIAPQNLENELKSNAIISQAMVHGDRRKFLSALVTVNEETARNVAGSSTLGYSALVQEPPVREAVDQAVQALNGTLPSYETIKKYAILPSDFSQESGELTPTLKVKRKLVTERNRQLLDSFYDEKLLE
jgi:long-chain acyl-CoA synthetase